MKQVQKLIAACLLMAIGGGFVYLIMQNNALKQELRNVSNNNNPNTTTQNNTSDTSDAAPNSTTETSDIKSSASPSHIGITEATIDQYLLDYANYEYQYKVDHNYITDYTISFYQSCSATSGKGAIYDINYTNKRNNARQEYFFVGVRYTKNNDGTLNIIDFENDNDHDLNDILEDAWDEGFTCE